MVNGSFNLHALNDGGVLVPSSQNVWEELQVVAMDTALVAIGEPQVLPDIFGPAEPEKGFNFCLFNNAWGTNYVMWTPYAGDVGASLKSRCARPICDVTDALLRPFCVIYYGCIYYGLCLLLTGNAVSFSSFCVHSVHSGDARPLCSLTAWDCNC
jgi:hypothetical protein